MTYQTLYDTGFETESIYNTESPDVNPWLIFLRNLNFKNDNLISPIKEIKDFIPFQMESDVEDQSKESSNVFFNTLLSLISRNRYQKNIMIENHYIQNFLKLLDSKFLDSIQFDYYFSSLEKLYKFRGSHFKIWYFFRENERYLSFVSEAHEILQEYFPSCQYILEIRRDPEELINEELMIYIKTNQKPEIATEKLFQLDEDWFLLASDIYGEKACINLELH